MYPRPLSGGIHTGAREKEVQNPLEKELAALKQINEANGLQIRFGYFTMQEQIPVREGSIDFLAKTDEWIREYIPGESSQVFCVADNSARNAIYEGGCSFAEWVGALVS